MKTFQLSDIDRKILSELQRNGRVPFTELAQRLNIPTSTCHSRIRSLEASGVIRGYTVDVNPEAVGAVVQALILLRVLPYQREQIPELTETLRRIPGVQRLFLIGGDKDFVLHVSCPSVPELRDLIANHLGSNRALDQSQTQIVFEYHVGEHPV